jgi:cystathionine beta-synthase
MAHSTLEHRATVLNSILDTVGWTPMVRLSNLFKDFPGANIYAKLEMFNPNGSSKDRIALYMIEQAEQEGKIKPGDTLVEPSSGNTGLGIAMAGALKGYRVVVTMPKKMSLEKYQLLRAFGAEVVWCPTEAPHGDPDNYVEVAERMARENQNTHVLNQLDNPANPEAHYRFSGPEIWQQTQGKIDYYVAGIGTSGTIIGTGRYLKEKNPNIQVVAIDPAGSVYSGDEPGSYLVEGIGYDYFPSIYDPSVVDKVIRVDDKESFLAARELALKEAILAGGSTGSVVAGLRKLLREVDYKGKTFVMLAHDTGRNHLTKMYNDEWMQEKGFFDDQGQ